MLPFPSSPPARISLFFPPIFPCHEELEDAGSHWKMILFRIFRFLGVKKSWVLVADNEGNTFWCAKSVKVLWGVSAFRPLASPLPSPCHMY